MSTANALLCLPALPPNALPAQRTLPAGAKAKAILLGPMV